jgi:hypothetical protein
LKQGEILLLVLVGFAAFAHLIVFFAFGCNAAARSSMSMAGRRA